MFDIVQDKDLKLITLTLFASPADITKDGFFFSNLTEYRAECLDLMDDPLDDIEYLDIRLTEGTDFQKWYANVYNPYQGGMSQWFSDIYLLEKLDPQDLVKILYLRQKLYASLEDCVAYGLDRVILAEGKVDTISVRHTTYHILNAEDFT